MIQRSPSSTLFPYTTLFRSMGSVCGTMSVDGEVDELHTGDETLGSRYLPRVAPSADGRAVVAVREAMNEPPEVVALDVGAREDRSEEHTSELQSRFDLVCRL